MQNDEIQVFSSHCIGKKELQVGLQVKINAIYNENANQNGLITSWLPPWTSQSLVHGHDINKLMVVKPSWTLFQFKSK